MTNTKKFTRPGRLLSLAVAGVMVLSLVAASSASATQASANSNRSINGNIPVEVTRIDGTVPLIVGGTVLILNEEAVSRAPVTTFDFIDGFGALDMHFRQSSVEQFTSTDFETARAISGDANGTITATRNGSKVATGSYKLSMSNTPECQMKGHGTWSMESDKFTVSGDVVTCVNWEASIDNFLGTIDVTGDVTMKEPPVAETTGPVRKLLRGLLGGLLG